MAASGNVTTDLIDVDLILSPAGKTTETQTGSKDAVSLEKRLKNEEEEEELEEDEELEDEEEEEEEEMSRSAHLEPSTLPWPGDKNQTPVMDHEDEEEARMETKNKSKWRESMPEGERWRDEEEEEEEAQKTDGGGAGSLADDEEEEEEEEESKWSSEKSALGFTPHVTIVCPSSKEPEERVYREEKKEEEEEEMRMMMEPDSERQVYPEWREEDDKLYLCDHLCSEKLRLALATLAGALLCPLLVWGGYALLPFDPPLLQSAPLRLVYTLRCAFFASIPIMLGVVVQGVARLRYGVLQPLYRSDLLTRDVFAHWHYVSESLGLFLFYFLQLVVMATYISHDLVKLVPLLTIVFVFGRLVYWLCLSLGSSVRALGFSLSFVPVLLMLGVNLYFVCSSDGQDAVFSVAPPTTAPPPKQRWWG